MNDQIKSAYFDKMSAQMNEASATMLGLKAKAEITSAEVRLGYHKKIEEWNAKEPILKQQLEELRVVGAESYENIKSKIQNTWNEMTTLVSSVKEK